MTTYPAIIGLRGRKRAGKDTVGKIIMDHTGYSLSKFADPLYQMAYELNPIIGPNERLRHAVNTYGWEHCKDRFPEVRYILQRLGTEAGRGVLGEDVWVTAWTNHYLDLCHKGNVPGVVVTDVRFPNENDAIHRWGGKVILVERPQYGQAEDGHASEHALDDVPPDAIIMNDVEDDFTGLARLTLAVVQGLV